MILIICIGVRSEVDHLMALLRERAIDKPVEEEHKTSKPVSFHEHREELTNTIVRDHDTESFRISKSTDSAVRVLDIYLSMMSFSKPLSHGLNVTSSNCIMNHWIFSHANFIHS